MTGRAFACSTAVCLGLLAPTPYALAASVDLPQPGGNTVQASAGQDVFLPQLGFNGPNISDNTTSANSAVGRGNGTTGVPFLLGTGAGNVVQFATGGNILNPQVAVGADNTSVNTTTGNLAKGDGNRDTTTIGPGQTGALIDGNGNVVQFAVLQGNIVNPQVAIFGSNTATNTSTGNTAQGVGNRSSTVGAGPATLIDGNGNVVQIEILSNDIIAPQVSVGGSNTTTDTTVGNTVAGAGNHGTVLAGHYGGLFSVTGNGNVTQIAIASNMVVAPQIVIPLPKKPAGTNTSFMTAVSNNATGAGNGASTTVALPSGKNVLTGAVLGNGIVNQTANSSGAVDNPQVVTAPLGTLPKVLTPKAKAPATTASPAASTAAPKAHPVADAVKNAISKIKGK